MPNIAVMIPVPDQPEIPERQRLIGMLFLKFRDDEPGLSVVDVAYPPDGRILDAAGEVVYDPADQDMKMLRVEVAVSNEVIRKWGDLEAAKPPRRQRTAEMIVSTLVLDVVQGAYST